MCFTEDLASRDSEQVSESPQAAADDKVVRFSVLPIVYSGNTNAPPDDWIEVTGEVGSQTKVREMERRA